MKNVLLVSFVITNVFVLTARAQDVKAQVLGTDFRADERVVELDVPEALDGVRFVIFWETAGGQSSGVVRVTRAGKHVYEMRHLPQWEGQIRAAAIALPGITGTTKTPTIPDELDMFLEPERITPNTINLLIGHTLFGRSWNVVLLILLPIATFCLAIFKKKPLIVSLTLGFVVAWAALDLRTIYDHGVIAYKMETTAQGMFPMTDVKIFSDRASEIIGGETWGLGRVVGVVRSFIQYRLAEHQFVREGSGMQPVFWITQDANEGEVVYQHAGYYLVKKDQR